MTFEASTAILILAMYSTYNQASMGTKERINGSHQVQFYEALYTTSILLTRAQIGAFKSDARSHRLIDAPAPAAPPRSTRLAHSRPLPPRPPLVPHIPRWWVVVVLTHVGGASLCWSSGISVGDSPLPPLCYPLWTGPLHRRCHAAPARPRRLLCRAAAGRGGRRIGC